MGGSLKIPSDLSLPLLYIISNNLFPNNFFLWCKFICILCLDIDSSMTLMSVLKEGGDDKNWWVTRYRVEVCGTSCSNGWTGGDANPVVVGEFDGNVDKNSKV